MDTAPVNWEILDALIIDFAKSEKLIEDSVSSSSPPSTPSSPSSSYHSKVIFRQIRRSLESGDIDSAIDLLRFHAPFVLDDHRILFRLQKQKFIELLRRGTVEDRDSAIQCLRTALAPCALDAYPEAYEEFKHVLLALIYDKDDQTSPVANEWSERRRFEIAGLMSSILRVHLHAYDPVFAMTLRYLISIHKGFCFHRGIISPISDLTERLLLDERDPPATPQESLYEAPPFDEVDIQALAHAVELTRQGAVDSLRVAKGDLCQAFKNELCRMRFDVPMLDELVREYCVYRGIVDSGCSSLYEAGYITSSTKSPKVDCGRNIRPVNGAHANGSPENNLDMTSMQQKNVERQYSCDLASSLEDCSTSESRQSEHSRVKLPRNRDHTVGERIKRRRWMGRQEDLDFISSISSRGCNKQAVDTITGESEKHPILQIERGEDKYKILLDMKELASKGMAGEVVEEVNTIDSNFFGQNPALLFQLKQVEFLKLVSSGDHAGALKVARSHLGPLVARDPAFIKPLKETLLTLLRPNEDAFGKGLSLHVLATSLQVAIGRRIGIEEPQLMKIVKETLHTHSSWFKLQMCNDHFESILRIDSLKEVNTPFLAVDAVTLKSNSDSCTHGSSQLTTSSNARMPESGSSPSQVSSTDVFDENAILKVMEFLALSRADAIHLLAQYDGNAETVIQQLFS